MPTGKLRSTSSPVAPRLPPGFVPKCQSLSTYATGPCPFPSVTSSRLSCLRCLIRPIDSLRHGHASSQVPLPSSTSSTIASKCLQTHILTSHGPPQASHKTTRHLSPQQIKQQGLNISTSCPLVKSRHYNTTMVEGNSGASSRNYTSMRAKEPTLLSSQPPAQQVPPKRDAWPQGNPLWSPNWMTIKVGLLQKMMGGQTVRAGNPRSSPANANTLILGINNINRLVPPKPPISLLDHCRG